MCVDSPLAVGFSFCIYCDDDALVTECFCSGVDDVWVDDGCCVHADFVCTCEKHFTHVFYGADSASYGEWDEAFFCGPSNDIDHGVTAITGCCDVKEYEFISFLFIVCDGAFDWVSGVTEVDEVGSFDYSAVGDIEAGDDSFC